MHPVPPQTRATLFPPVVAKRLARPSRPVAPSALDEHEVRKLCAVVDDHERAHRRALRVARVDAAVGAHHRPVRAPHGGESGNELLLQRDMRLVVVAAASERRAARAEDEVATARHVSPVLALPLGRVTGSVRRDEERAAARSRPEGPRAPRRNPEPRARRARSRRVGSVRSRARASRLRTAPRFGGGRRFVGGSLLPMSCRACVAARAAEHDAIDAIESNGRMNFIVSSTWSLERYRSTE